MESFSTKSAQSDRCCGMQELARCAGSELCKVWAVSRQRTLKPSAASGGPGCAYTPILQAVQAYRSSNAAGWCEQEKPVGDIYQGRHDIGASSPNLSSLRGATEPTLQIHAAKNVSLRRTRWKGWFTPVWKHRKLLYRPLLPDQIQTMVARWLLRRA